MSTCRSPAHSFGIVLADLEPDTWQVQQFGNWYCGDKDLKVGPNCFYWHIDILAIIDGNSWHNLNLIWNELVICM